MSFLCTAERRTHVTDKTLDISDVCLSVELFNTYLKKITGIFFNTTYSSLLWLSFAPLTSYLEIHVSVFSIIILTDINSHDVTESLTNTSDMDFVQVFLFSMAKNEPPNDRNR